MEPYYLGGYFLMKTKLFGWSPDTNGIVQTCSGCINTQVFDYWCRSWAADQKAEIGLTNETAMKIEKWADQNFRDDRLKWSNTFSDLETVKAFKNLFFADRSDMNIYAIYLDETDANSLIAAFENEEHNKGEFGLRLNLRHKIEEAVNLTEELLGYDLIGVEFDGGFHSFHCHGIGRELAGRFGLTLNQHGLFSHIPDPEAVRSYLNSGTAPVEPVPWYIAKTKRLKNQPLT